MYKLIDHIYLFVAIFFAGLSQILVRWQMGNAGQLPELFWDKLFFVFHFLLRPWVWVALFATFISCICWLITLTKFELSYAYPWTSIIYVYLLLAGLFIFGDSITFNKILGTVIIIFGVYIIAK
jgi:multidrug transporter EmrE-like cation transporter